MIGILAYGSLIANPGTELEKIVIRKIPCETPFFVEYARRSKSRQNAPTLTIVPQNVGSPVRGTILVLKPDTDPTEAKNLLFRRELHKETDKNLVYDDVVQRAKTDALVIETLLDIQGFKASVLHRTQSQFYSDLRCRSFARRKSKIAGASCY